MNAGLANTVAKMAAADPEAARTHLVERGMAVFSDGLLEAMQTHAPCRECGCRGKHSWAFRLFARIAKLIDEGPRLVAFMFERLGVRSEQELVRRVSDSRAVEEMTEDERVETVERYLVDVYGRRPELLQRSPLELKSAA